MLYGSLVADALALGAHWTYEQEELTRDFGRVTDYLAPRADSYHPTKRAGEQTHYGDQTLVLMESVEEAGGEPALPIFAARWRGMWAGYGDYFDHATKETLANLERGVPAGEAASDSNELGGAARTAPLLVALSGAPVEEAVAAARTQTALTHGAPLAGDAAEFLTRACWALLAGAEIAAALATAGADGSYAELDAAALLARVAATDGQELGVAAETLGLSCPTPKALPTTMLLLRRDLNLEEGLIDNVMVGGDNAARGLALGMVLGARHGRAAIPERWIKGLIAGSRVEAYLERMAPKP
jgi:ADP-ribosylglycohydrolase